MAELPRENVAYEVVCPHCKKTFEAEILKASSTVPIVGHITIGGVVNYDSENFNDFGEAPLPPDAPANTVALLVKGDAMPGVAEDGWVVYYDDKHDGAPEDYIGKLCIVEVADGRVTRDIRLGS